MKKIFTSLFAMAAVFCASATPTYTVNPESESTIDDRDNFTVTFTFDEEVTVKSVEFIGGARFNATVTPGTLDVTASKTVEVAVPNTVWGTPDAGQYLLEVNLPEIFDKDGNQIMVDAVDDEGNAYSYAYTASAYYSSPDTTPAAYLRYEPASDEVTAWEAYNDGWGAVDFIFSGEVDVVNASASVAYLLTNGDVIPAPVPADDIWADWNMWTGEYNISIMLPASSSLTEANLAMIMVSLTGIQSNGVAIEVPTATYVAAATKAISPAGIRIESNTIKGITYNVNGTRVN